LRTRELGSMTMDMASHGVPVYLPTFSGAHCWVTEIIYPSHPQLPILVQTELM